MLDEECCKSIIHQISLQKHLGFFEPAIDPSLPSYEGVRPYSQAAFLVHAGWFSGDVLRIAVEPFKTQAGWFFWKALRAGAASFSPLFCGNTHPGTMRIDSETLRYLCTDAFLASGS